MDFSASALKGRDVIAQGEALGEYSHTELEAL